MTDHEEANEVVTDFNDLVRGSSVEVPIRPARDLHWKRLTWWGWVFCGVLWAPLIVIRPLVSISEDASAEGAARAMGAFLGGLLLAGLMYLFAMGVAGMAR